MTDGELRVLDPNEIERVLGSCNFECVWQNDPLIPNRLAMRGIRQHLAAQMPNRRSLGLSYGKDFGCVAIGSVPQWDSRFFGFDSYNLKYMNYKSYALLHRFMQLFEAQMREWGIKYVYSKVPAHDHILAETFGLFGFTVIDIRMTFARKTSKSDVFPIDSPNVMYELAKNRDIEEIAEISRKVSKVDRFHADRNFEQAKADELYYHWVKNGAASKDIVKAVVGDRIAGFHMSYEEELLREPEGSRLSISDLMGVLPGYQGRGIGEGLFQNYFGLAASKAMTSIEAGVHIDNVPSMRLHEKVGFRSIWSEIGFRKWY